jgi:hypothetical protein
MKINRPFAFWGTRARRLRALRVGLEGLALQGQTGSRHVTESLRGHQNIKGWSMQIDQPFVFSESLNFRLCPPRFPLPNLSAARDIFLAAALVKSSEFSSIILLTTKHNASIIQPF